MREQRRVGILWHVGDGRFFAGRRDYIDLQERDDGRDGRTYVVVVVEY